MNKIKNFIEANKDMTVQIVDSVSYNQTDVITDIYRSINTKFENDTWKDGTSKTYFDLSKVMSTAIKMPTDLDTKDLGMHAENKEAVGMVSLVRGAVKNHLKNAGYNEKFNHVKDELIDFGHIILKKTKEGTETVDLRMIIRQADIMDIQKATPAEMHPYSWEEMLQRKHKYTKNGWKEVKILKEKMEKDGLTEFLVYEWWTQDEFDGQFTKGCIEYLDRSKYEPDDAKKREDWNPQVELRRYKTPWTIPIKNGAKKRRLEKEGYLIDGELPMYPYDEQRFVTVKGRWLGAGVYEITAPLREAYNQTMNNKLHYDEVYGKGLFLHTKGQGGKSLTQAALTALENSGVVELQNGAELSQLRLQSLTSDFIVSADKFFEFARQLLGLTAQGTGEELPASMSATSAMINQAKAKTLYDYVLEQQGLLWQRWFSNFELNDIMEDMDAQKWIKIEGNERDIREIIEPFAENYLNMKLKEQLPVMMATGQIDPQMQLKDEIIKDTKEELVSQILKKKSIFVEFTKKLVKNASFFMEFYVTAESFNKIERLKTLVQLKADAMVNPNSSLSVEAIEEEILDITGVGINRFKKDKDLELLPPLAPMKDVPQQQLPQITPPQ